MWIHMLDFQEMLYQGHDQYIQCAYCIYYKGGYCRLNPVAIEKESNYFCGQLVARQVPEGV